MDLRTALKSGIAQLRAAGVSSETLAAELLLLHATGHTRTRLYSHPEEPLGDDQAARYRALLDRRISGEPVQHLTGKQEFWGLPFNITPDVLIPRPETEHVIEVALDRLALRDLRAKNAQNMSGEGLRIADVGTGSGCIAIALAKELPAAAITALDVSRAALAIARQNAEQLGFAARIAFLESDLFAGVTGGEKFDLVVSNPPYIGHREAATLAREVRDHEPALALYGGEEGYEFYGALIAQAADRIEHGGLLVLELGHNSLSAVRPLLESPQWSNIGTTDDLAGITRVIAAERT